MSADTGVLYAHPDGRLLRPNTGETVSTWSAPSSFEYGVTRPTLANTWYHDGANLAAVLAPQGPNNGTEYRITTPGIYENLDVTAHVVINAPSATAANPVIFRRNRVRGVVGTGGKFVYVLNASEPGAVIVEQNLLDPDDRTVINDGIRSGGNVIAQRNAIYGMVDGFVLIYGGNTIRGNLVREHVILPQETQVGGYTHSDGCQVMGGANQTLVGNDFADSFNACLMVKAESPGVYGPITDLLIDRNWLDGGEACMHLFKQSADPAMTVTATSNRFGANAGQSPSYRMWVGNTVTLTHSGNVLDADSTPVSPTFVNMG